MNRRDILASSAALAIAALATTRASADTSPLPPDDPLNPAGIRMAGVKMIAVRSGKYKVWTKTVGDGPVKILLLHGGPGAGHDYLEAMESFLPQAGIQLIYYDQLGCGNSDRPDDPALWTLPAYVDEVEDVRRGLGLDRFVLYGHSWGGMLAIDYALKYEDRVRGMVVSNMTAGMKSYQRRTNALKNTLLDPVSRARLSAMELKGAFDSAEYQQIVMRMLYPKMLCRLDPWPEPLLRSFRNLNGQIYQTMQGKSEFLVTGNLKHWERWNRLLKIRTKTLTIGAVHDEMDPADMILMSQMMPDAQSVICPNGSHMCMWDDQAFYFDRLVSWLRRI
jgi:proline iminopeptidase